jgi:hypothetical protein
MLSYAEHGKFQAQTQERATPITRSFRLDRHLEWTTGRTKAQRPVTQRTMITSQDVAAARPSLLDCRQDNPG